jgi:glycerol-3-phosphate dehydrogenase subunit C
MCYMTKCPYVPPHPWNVDFPHVMLRAKAVKFKNGDTTFRDRLLTSTDTLGMFAGIPIVTQAVNAVNRNALSRNVLQSVLGVHKDRELPPFAPTKFRSAFSPSSSFPVKNGERTPGKVAIFATCYVNYNEPGLGHDLLALLAHNEIPYVIVEKEACCGMPKLELGDMESVDRLKRLNMPVLAKLASDGYAILSAVPSCTLMFKQELPLMYPDDPETIAVRDAMFDPFEYFVARKKDGLLKTDFKSGLGTVSYHIPCHSRVQNMGQKTREMLESLPGTKVNTVERCAGHDGTWGVKTEYFEKSMKIGRPVFRQMGETPEGAPDYVSSDCPIASRHIMQGIRENDGSAGEFKAEKAHPLTLLRKAYGL